MGKRIYNHEKLLIVFVTQKLGLLFCLKFLLQYSHPATIVKKGEILTNHHKNKLENIKTITIGYARVSSTDNRKN